jgi:subtilisin family serine protease
MVRRVTRHRGFLAALLGLALLLPTVASAEQPSPPAVDPTPAATFSSDRVIVQWAPGANHGDKVEARAEAGVDFGVDLGSREFQLVAAEPDEAANAIRSLRADPAVAVAERDSFSGTDAVPNDPMFNQLWGLRNVGLPGIGGAKSSRAGADIGAAAAWDRTVGSPTVVIADIDSGYRFEHPDLAPVAWGNPGEVANGIDDDGNGIADDLHGADFVGANAELSPLPVDGNPTDEDLLSGGHGVHTAGTIGAAGNNGIGIAGVGWNLRLMPLRVCSRLPSAEDNRCPTSAQVAAVNYAAAKGARAANMSLGGATYSQALVNAIASHPQILYVASAGNDGENNEAVPHYPCNYQPLAQALPAGSVDNVICVAATTQTDNIAGFSNFGAASVDLGAPGAQTLSTYPFRPVLDEDFELADLGAKWAATGANGGFERSNEAPLTSFGITDSPGATPVANTVRESTSNSVSLPAGYSQCALEQTRTLSLSGSASFSYSVLLNSSVVASTTPTSSGRKTLDLANLLAAGGNVQVRVRYAAGTAPAAGNGAWLDEIDLRCAEPVGQASRYAFLQGTSMSTPHVTGAAGLLFSLRPSASVVEVRSALLAGVAPDPALKGRTVTGGRLYLPGAIAALEAVPPALPAPSPACKVPKLTGKTLAKARKGLRRAGCSLRRVDKPKRRHGRRLGPLVVKSSQPHAGATSATGKVTVKLGPKPKRKHRPH